MRGLIIQKKWGNTKLGEGNIMKILFRLKTEKEKETHERNGEIKVGI
jgi:hypothetical protein